MTVADLIEYLDDLEPDLEVSVISADTRAQPAAVIRSTGPVVVIFSSAVVPFATG